MSPSNITKHSQHTLSLSPALVAAFTVSVSESEWASCELSTDAGDVPTAEVLGALSSDSFKWDEVLSLVDLFNCRCGLTTFFDFSAAFLDLSSAFFHLSSAFL